MKKTMVYVGAWGRRDDPDRLNNKRFHGEGVYAFSFDSETGRMEAVNLAYSQDAGIICVSPDQKYVYAANESRDFVGGLMGSGGGVSAFAIDPRTGGLSPLNSLPAYGACTAYVSISTSGRYLIAANHGSHPDVVCNYVPDGNGGWKLQRGYDDASIAAFHINEDGTLDRLTDLKIFRDHGCFVYGGQSTSHIHCVQIDKDNTVIACNRGGDRLEVFRLNEQTGQLEQTESHHYRPGLAPRHLAFVPGKDHFYVCNETFPCATVWKLDRKTGTVTDLQLIETESADVLAEHPNEYPTTEVVMGPNPIQQDRIPSDVHVHPNGKFVYVSNRNPGSIACFRADPETGLLTFIEKFVLDDTNPRGFQIDPTGRFMLIGLKDTDRVGVYELDGQTGRIGRRVFQTGVPCPCSIHFAQLEG